MIPLLPRLFQAIEKRLAREEEDRVQARAHFLRLLRESPRRQRRRVARDPALATPALAGLLLETAADLAPREPGRAEHLAGLALTLAERLTPPWGEFLAGGLAGSAWAWIGEARRGQGDLEGAEEAQEEARRRLDPLPPDSPERGVRCRLLARLRRDQERSDEALALAARALELAEAREDREEAGAAALDLAWLELGELEAGAAFPLFERAAAAYPEPDPAGPWLSARRGLALAAADLQDEPRVDRVLRELERAGPGLAPLDRLRLARVEAEVDRARDRGERAARTLERVWPALAEQGAPREALDAALDLLRLYLEGEHRGEPERLAAALPSALPLPARLAATVAAALEEVLRSGLPLLERLERLERLQVDLRHFPPVGPAGADRPQPRPA